MPQEKVSRSGALGEDGGQERAGGVGGAPTIVSVEQTIMASLDRRMDYEGFHEVAFKTDLEKGGLKQPLTTPTPPRRSAASEGLQLDAK